MPFNFITLEVLYESLLHVFRNRTQLEVMVVHGMFLLSCRIKIVGKICDSQCFLIDTFLKVLRSSRDTCIGLR